MDPFLTLGSPNTALTEDDIERLNNRIPGATVTPAEFIPKEIPGVALNPKHEGERSYGISISVEDYTVYQPFENGLILLSELMQQTPDATTREFLYKLSGTRDIDDIISGKLDPDNVEFNLSSFMNNREKYLIY